MRVALVDDELYWRKQLSLVISNYGITEKDLKVFESGEELLFSEIEYNIVFMDIELGSENGLQTTKKYKEKYPYSLVIILTTHTEYSRMGYQVNAFRYIDKTHLSEIEEAIHSAEKKIKANKMLVFVDESLREYRVFCEEISYIETSVEKKHYILVHCQDNVLHIRNSISEIEKELQDYGFYRIHRSYLVSIPQVDTFTMSSVIMKTGERLSMSRRNYQDFKNQYWEWKYNQGNL